MADTCDTKSDLLRIADDISTEGWAETIAGIVFGDEEMKASGIKKRRISYEMTACLEGELLCPPLL